MINIFELAKARKLAGGGGGGKAPVLTELTVTENGVYDKPVIVSGLEPITWDGVIGDKVTAQAKNSESGMYVKVSDKILLAEDLAGCTVIRNDGESISLDEPYAVIPTSGCIIIAMGQAMSVADVNALPASCPATFVETGTYFLYDNGEYITSLTFPESASTTTPADGWNKVTVNVPVGEPHAPNMIPNDGSYVHNIYLNTALYIEDEMPEHIVAEINKIPEECWIKDGDIGLIYQVLQGDNNNNAPWSKQVLIQKGNYSTVGFEGVTYRMEIIGAPDNWGGYQGGSIEIAEITENGETLYVWSAGVETSDYEGGCFEFNSDTFTQSTVLDTTEKIGTANHLLTNLFSIRPFVTE